ncbi:hypothetical protein FIBSPDRAFT_876844 [Athelia psychrophila]|uniref:Uncharacterized protein n=1 Tax=Athelia psychrophila TaxID=1759441 RepID=A0A167WH48_9AGAM|nr:hypothetical protein FIBSPDRAFT_876844 [Fibularhizoctonia sp. CBS 109695]
MFASSHPTRKSPRFELDADSAESSALPDSFPVPPLLLYTAYLSDRLLCGLLLLMSASHYYPSHTWHFSHRWNAIACTSIVDSWDFSASLGHTDDLSRRAGAGSDAFHVAIPQCPRPQPATPRF